jgi:hypothetical protein
MSLGRFTKPSKHSNVVLNESTVVGSDKFLSIFAVVSAWRPQDRRDVAGARRVDLQSMLLGESLESCCVSVPCRGVEDLFQRPVAMQAKTTVHKHRARQARSTTEPHDGISGFHPVGVASLPRGTNMRLGIGRWWSFPGINIDPEGPRSKSVRLFSFCL